MMRTLEWIGAGVVVSVLALGVAVAADFSANFGATSANPRDVGLPAYPGAWPHKDNKKDEDSSAKLWGGFGAFGMKIAAVELDSNDQPGRIAAFYSDALRRQGRYLDCSPGRPRPPKAGKESDALDCGDDDVKPGGFLFKIGTKKDFRVVGIEPEGRGSKIALVSIQLRGFK